jgi:hypothetical protein
MKSRNWNIAMLATLTALAALLIPLFATASFDFGFADFGFVDAGAVETPEDSQSIFDFFDGFGPFDTNFQPFDDIAGNPFGPDAIAPGPNGNFPPSVPPPSVPPSSPPGDDDDEDDDTLGIFINSVFLNDPFAQEAGKQVPLRVTFENDGNKDLDGTKVIVTIPDLAVRGVAGPFDLDDGDKVSKMILLELPEGVQPGTYTVRLQIHTETADAEDRIVHREIEIIDHS